jgi:diphthine-ammonia ligase
MEEVFVSWSGGKDCSLACYRAVRQGLKVRYLCNMVSEDGKRSWSHGLDTRWLKMQAEAMGIPLMQRRTTSAQYETEFKNMLRELRQEGITAGVFGDIDFDEHLKWIQQTCAAGGVAPRLPLWGEDQNKLMRELVDLQFEPIVVATKAELMGEEWLGRRVDRQFIFELEELGKTKQITPCGEAGEYHTLVVDSPLFKKRLVISQGRKELREEHWFYRIEEAGLQEK